MKLVKGAGSPTEGACWMSALHYYTRKDVRSWSDHPKCVSPMIRMLCIALNDRCSDGEREALIGPHLFAPIGTNTGIDDERKRAFLCADRAVRVWAPMALEKRWPDHAANLRACAPIVDKASALEGKKIAAAYAAAAAAYAAAAEAAHADADADAAYARSAWKKELLQLILDCCAIGERKEVTEACPREAVLEMLER